MKTKYCVQRIIAFYQRHRVDYADYFLAAWRFRHRHSLGRPELSLADAAREAGLSDMYLRTIWETLREVDVDRGPLAVVRDRFGELSDPDAGDPDALRRGCEALRDLVLRERKKLVAKISDLRAPGISNGSQSLVLWKNRQQAANHRRFAEDQIALDSIVKLPADEEQVARLKTSLERFCAVFPDAFVVSERAVGVDPLTGGQGRLLNEEHHDHPHCAAPISGACRRPFRTAVRHSECDRGYSTGAVLLDDQARIHTSWIEYILLFIVVTLFPVGAFIAIRPILRKSADGAQRFNVVNGLVAVLLVIAFGVLVVGLGSVVYRCDVLQVPNCDWPTCRSPNMQMEPPLLTVRAVLSLCRAARLRRSAEDE